MPDTFFSFSQLSIRISDFLQDRAQDTAVQLYAAPTHNMTVALYIIDFYALHIATQKVLSRQLNILPPKRKYADLAPLSSSTVQQLFAMAFGTYAYPRIVVRKHDVGVVLLPLPRSKRRNFDTVGE